MASQKEKEEMKDLVKLYKRQIEKELGTRTYKPNVTSREYQDFKKAYMPTQLTLYEKLCNLSGKNIRVKAG